MGRSDSIITSELVDKFQNPVIKEALDTLSKVCSKRHLGIKRWDDVIDNYKYSGVVKIPVKLGYRVFQHPFYFVFEKMQDEEMIYFRPVKGEPYRVGEVYGFFGLLHFTNYELGDPIILVEGISDWEAVRRFYPHVLVTLTAGIGQKQLHFISNLTRKVFLGYDSDGAGQRAYQITQKKLDKVGVKSQALVCPQKDWGKLIESDWGVGLLEETFINFYNHIWINSHADTKV